MEGFQCAMSLDLNMVYDHIHLTEDASNLCMTVILWRKYHYKSIPMRVINSLEILQYKMNYLFQGFEFICAYRYELLLLTIEACTFHVQKSELTLT